MMPGISSPKDKWSIRWEKLYAGAQRWERSAGSVKDAGSHGERFFKLLLMVALLIGKKKKDLKFSCFAFKQAQESKTATQA